MSIYIAIVALSFERVFAYPMVLQMLYRHPVEWMGSFIAWFEAHYNQGLAIERKRAGMIMLFFLVFFSLLISVLLVYLTNLLPFGWFFQGLIAFTLLSQNQLGKAVKAVADGLEISLQNGREAVRHIVGRDVKNLDAAEVSRAGIETLAENASDGFIAPLFYLLIFGLPGIVIYKAINTADSMVGHKSEKYKDFGYASAVIDDVVNYIPARICALLFVLAAMIYRPASWQGAIRSVKQDAKKHASPNAGWPESAFAGALGFGLGGKRSYKGEMLDLAQMGDGRRDLGVKDINSSLGFYNLMSGFVLYLVFIAGFIFMILQY